MLTTGGRDKSGNGNGGGVTAPSAPSFFVAVPCYDGKTHVISTQTLANLVQLFTKAEVKFEFKFEVGMPYVSMARNNLMAYFMKSGMTDMVFLDADLGVNIQDFQALLASPEDVVVGAYRKKCEEEVYAIMLLTDKDSHPVYKNGGFLAEGGPTGFMKIKRHVFEKMIAAYPEMEYDDYMAEEPRWNFFGTFLVGRRWYGDDYGFCYLWRQLGGEVFVLPDITMTHAGSKNFTGNMYHHIVATSQKTSVVMAGEHPDSFQPSVVTLDQIKEVRR